MKMLNNFEGQQQGQQQPKVVTESPLKGIEEDYIEQIKQLKEKSVPKEAFEELEAEHRRLINELVNGQSPQTIVEDKPDIAQMRKELYDPENQFSNLEYASRTLALRKAIMESGQPDPFLPNGPRAEVTNFDIESAQKVADVLEDCIEAANGSNDMFTAALKARLVEPLMPKR